MRRKAKVLMGQFSATNEMLGQESFVLENSPPVEQIDKNSTAAYNCSKKLQATGTCLSV